MMKGFFSIFTAKNPASPVVKEKVAGAPPLGAEPAAKATVDHKTLVLIAAALAAHGHSQSKIVAIRTLRNEIWTQAGRVETVQNRNRMYY